MNPNTLFVSLSRMTWAVLFLFSLTDLSGQSGRLLSGKELSDEIFKNPTQEYGIRCWWWWLNGNVTKEAITRDLEEMKAKGFSGACIFDAGGQNQRGNGDVPEGPLWGSPAWRELYVHAINEAARLGLVMSLSIQSGWNLGGPDVTPEEAAKQVVYSETSVKGGVKIDVKLMLPKIRDDFYQDIAVLAVPSKHFANRHPIRDLAGKTASKELGSSAPETRPLLFDVPPTENEEDGKPEEVINLTEKFKNGTLQWDAPAGEWTLLRMGYSATRADVSTSSGKWKGRVLDYLSEKHFNRYWDTHVEPLLAAVGNKAGTVLRYLQTDSFEAGGMNWTEGFEKEFSQRRGYDPTPYLPVLAGKIIGSRELSNRFLADFRKTISDCMADKHYRVFAERAEKFGMGIQPESAGPHAGPFDGLKNYGHSEIVMSEFWSPSPHRPRPADRFFVKQAAGAAKIYGKKLVGAESFTTIGPHWNDVIWSDMKSAADHEFCAGLNLIYLHTFTCSPKEMGMPGQEYFAGTHFNPNVTWWNYSTGFITYLNRIHYLMQEGVSQADVLYYYGDHIPNIGGFKESDPAGALPGYDYDLINEDRLLALTVQKGQLALPNGAAYKILAIPDHQVLSLAALKKIAALVEGGATVVGKKTLTTSSLVNYPKAEKIREEIANKLWGEGISEKGQKKTGKGMALWGKTAKEALLAAGIQPDLEISKSSPESSFDFIHRKWNKADYFFISNQTPKEQKGEVSFRISGKLPELWNAVTGEIRPAVAFRQEKGRTICPLEFDPYGSWFVVFRKPISVGEKGKKDDNFADFQKVMTLGGAWEVSFDPKWGAPSAVTFETLESWTQRPEEGIKYYSGTAVYRKTFDLDNMPENPLFLDLGQVLDVGVARVKLNGKDLGIVWTPPFRVSAAGAFKTKNNLLEIEVANSWRNRLAGDRDKPESERFTKTNIKILPEWKLLDSGLMGPVEILLVKD